jgi:hypothetical protein
MKNLNLTALLRSTILTIWFVVIVSIGAELSPALKSFFVKVGGHHWTGKSLLAVALFALCYFVHNRIKETKKAAKWISAALWSAILGGLMVFGFFVWHYLEG